MKRRTPRAVMVLATCLALSLASGAVLQAAQKPDAQVHAAPAAKINKPGLPNLGCISETFYRGGQPEEQGYQQLKELGVDVVVNFRDEKDKNSKEKTAVESLGMRYVSIPWTGYENPDNKQVAEFLTLLRDNPDKTIFIHCRRGAERTGVMVAAYRIAFQNWTPEQALEEMEKYKFRGFWFGHLKKYVRSFPQQLETDPNLKQLRTPALRTAQ